jgi:ribosomal protein S18 acetylase RimI-like enzyme
MDTIVNQVSNLGKQVVSPDYLNKTEHIIEKYVESDKRKLFVYITETGEIRNIDTKKDALENTKISGFTIGGAYNETEFENEIYATLNEVIQNTDLKKSEFPISQVKIVAVNPENQENGIGSELTAAILGEIVKVTPVVAMIWEKENNANKNLAEAYGERQTLLQNYFPNEWSCRECGIENNCNCNVSVYVWRP